MTAGAFDFARFTANIQDPELSLAVDSWCIENRKHRVDLVELWAQWIQENSSIRIDQALIQSLVLGAIFQSEIGRFQTGTGVGFYG